MPFDLLGRMCSILRDSRDQHPVSLQTKDAFAWACLLAATQPDKLGGSESNKPKFSGQHELGKQETYAPIRIFRRGGDHDLPIYSRPIRARKSD